AELARVRGLTRLEPPQTFFPNQGLVFQAEGDPLQCAVFRFHESERVLLPVRDLGEGIWGVKPRNPQQALAFDLLLDPAVSVVTLMGKAGTGKTLLCLAAGLQMMMEENTYTKLLVSRPIFPMGKDIGYLPGTAQEKLEPWMQPIFDNLEYLIGSPVSKSHPAKGYQALIDQGLINIEPLTYIRGRSIPNQFMIVDESQNLTPHEIKTIITRVGSGTKIVLTGDPYQIDNPYVDSVSNGLSHVVERFRTQHLAGHVTLIRGERSALAELAANIL
ncbi:MAG: PhoH family protein, partial [Candidatus Lambdaproteobacteria bacterium]|nr:PhoH family protein [Candidatus Lambdaproteobacteria bacterium]